MDHVVEHAMKTAAFVIGDESWEIIKGRFPEEQHFALAQTLVAVGLTMIEATLDAPEDAREALQAGKELWEIVCQEATLAGYVQEGDEDNEEAAMAALMAALFGGGGEPSDGDGNELDSVLSMIMAALTGAMSEADDE